jgi:predicted phage terminase large subunit-like protein
VTVANISRTKARVLIPDDPPPEGGAWEDFVPQPGPQTEFAMSSADIVIYGGQAGGGKTYGLLLDAVQDINVPYFNAVIFRRITKEITQPGGLWEESTEIYPFLGGDPVAGIYTWRFPALEYDEEEDAWVGPPTGRLNTIVFAHMEHAKNRFDWKGAQLNFIGFDELTAFTREQFFYMLSRNRSISGVPPRVRATTNPETDSWVGDVIEWWIDQEEFLEDGKTPNPRFGLPIPERSGVVRWFIQIDNKLIWADEPEELYKYVPVELLQEEDLENGVPPVTHRDFVKSLTFIQSSVYDNPALIRKNPQYVGNLFNLERVEREQLLHGNWKVKMEEGKVFPKGKAKIVEAIPAGWRIVARVRWWDFAGTAEEDIASEASARTASVKMALLLNQNGEHSVLIEHATAGWWNDDERETEMQNVAKTEDTKATAIRFEQEPGSAGLSVRRRTIKLFPGYDIKGRPASGKKEVRWKPLAAQWQGGNVLLLEGPWNREYLNEMNGVPNGRKDYADASSAGYNELTADQDEASTDPDDYITMRG